MPKHHAHFRDPCDCTFYEHHSSAFVLSNEQSKQTFAIDYEDLDWIRVYVHQRFRD